MPMPENANASAAAMTIKPSASAPKTANRAVSRWLPVPRITSMGRIFAARSEGMDAPNMHVATPNSRDPSHAPSTA